MKIIRKDNYDRDWISDKLICEKVDSYLGEKIVNFLNEKYGGDNSDAFYDLVEDNYKLYIYEL